MTYFRSVEVRPKDVARYPRMALTIPEQVAAAVHRSNHLLITFPQDYRLDAVASALAVAQTLHQQGKVFDVVADGYRSPAHDFLPSIHVAAELRELEQFIITVNLRAAGLEQLSYDLEGPTLSLYLTPRSGRLQTQDVSARTGEFRYDLIITVGAPDLAALGALYTHHREFFQRTPIINIDCLPSNEHFGHINVVDVTAAATAEVVADLLPALGAAGDSARQWDKKIATALLAGLIAATHSFRDGKVTAKTLGLASDLVAAGANRDGIIRALYQSQTLATLKLWGKTLTRLRGDPNGKLVWASVTEADFLEAEATLDELPGLTDALLAYLPTAEVVVLLAQEGATTTVRLTSLRNLHAGHLSRPFLTQGDRQVVTWRLVGRGLADAEREVIAAVRQNLEALQGDAV